MRRIAKLCLVSLPALLLSFLVLELFVFRLWVAVGDVPIEDYNAADRMIRYHPEQEGTSYPDNDIRHPVPFTVNHDGWNSFHSGYERPRNGKLRVGIIGDSYVAAFEVAPRPSLAGQLEATLGEENAEIYSFGIRGAPLSQYLHIARYVVATYKPDALVVVVVHNDFDESYRVVTGRYTKSFLHLRVPPDGTGITEIAPEPYEESQLTQWIRAHSSTFRFFFLSGPSRKPDRAAALRLFPSRSGSL